MINFISNLPRSLRTGGFSALNSTACDALSKIESVNYVGPVSPPVFFYQKLYSKMLRTCRSQGDFFFYSSRRLQSIAEQVRIGSRAEARLDCFHGFTPWISTAPPRPYVAWGDCTFRDYMNVYHQREKFRSSDLERIERAEAAWLRRASCVAFTSRWAAQRAVEHYDLDESLVRLIGIFGEVELPARDEYQGRSQFAFISTDFAAKGGPVAVAAFRRVQERHPDAMLVIVGAKPPEGVTDRNVIFAGYLRKEVTEENRRFRDILAQSCALVHPTSSDISPHCIVEAGCFGCPAISVRRFAIPELIEHQVTGLLIDDAADVLAVADGMGWMIEHKSEYARMRERAWFKAHNESSKEAFEQKLQALARVALGQCLPQSRINPHTVAL
jgi:glycosyltransferase involved in cell wall biosynthesis